MHSLKALAEVNAPLVLQRYGNLDSSGGSGTSGKRDYDSTLLAVQAHVECCHSYQTYWQHQQVKVSRQISGFALLCRFKQL